MLYGAFIIHLAWGDGEEMRGAGTPLLQPDSGGVSEGARDDTVLGNRQQLWQKAWYGLEAAGGPWGWSRAGNEKIGQRESDP